MIYSVVIKFEAEHNICFDYFPGQALHGLLFNLFKQQDKQRAAVLHNEYKKKPFTLSPILPYPKRRQGRWELSKGKEYFFRLTFLEQEWYLRLMDFFTKQQELELNAVPIEVTDILISEDDDYRAKAVNFRELYQQAESKQKIKFKFHSTTTFRKGDQHIIFPEAKYLFYNLQMVWEEFSPLDLDLSRDDLEEIYISRYDLQSTMEQFKNYAVKGFRGTCQYEIKSNLSSEKLKQLNLLANFAFYSGIGYKTTMGLGQAVRV